MHGTSAHMLCPEKLCNTCRQTYVILSSICARDINSIKFLFWHLQHRSEKNQLCPWRTRLREFAFLHCLTLCWKFMWTVSPKLKTFHKQKIYHLKYSAMTKSKNRYKNRAPRSCVTCRTTKSGAWDTLSFRCLNLFEKWHFEKCNFFKQLTMNSTIKLPQYEACEFWPWIAFWRLTSTKFKNSGWLRLLT